MKRVTLAVLLLSPGAATSLLAQGTPPGPPAGAAPVQPADPELVQARQLYLRLDDAAALAQIRTYLEQHPDHIGAREFEARCLFQLRRHDAALALLTALPERSPNGELLRADVLSASGEGAQALAVVDGVLQQHPRFLEAHLARVRALLALRDLAKASAEFEALRKVDPTRPEFVPLAARLLEEAKRLPEAQKAWESIVADPKRFGVPDAHVVRDAAEGVARVQFAAGRWDEAIASYTALLRGMPDCALWHYRLGLAQGMSKLPIDAIGNLQRALALDPGMAECRFRLAELLRTKQMVPEAIAEFEQLSEVPAYRREAARALAELLLKSGDLERALACVQEFEALAPATAAELEVGGLVHEKNGERAVAVERYRGCLALDPLQFDVLYRLALLLMRSDADAERAEGSAMMERYQRVVPVLPDIESLVAGLQMAPGNPAAMVGLAGILNVAAEYALAQPWIERALALRADDPRAQGIAGCIAANQHRDAEALAHFERAAQLAGADADPNLPGYIQALRKGEPLPLPLGGVVRGAASGDSDPEKTKGDRR